MSDENEKISDTLQEAYKNGWLDGHIMGRFGDLDNNLENSDNAWRSSRTKYYLEKIFKESGEIT